MSRPPPISVAADPAVPTLYVDAQFMSPYAMSAFVGLCEKGLRFDLRSVDLAANEQAGAAYAALSPTRRVPALVEGDFRLCESSAICEYLEDCHPPPAAPALYPADPRARAQARQLQAWLRSDFLPIRQERSTEVVFIKPTDVPLSQQARRSAEKLFAGLSSLLADGASHLFGAWSIADTDAALMLSRLVLNGDPVPDRLAAYALHQWQRPSVQRWVRQQRGG
ncbi:MAG TPA: glutathione transferase [Burkholderiaceae bacterium]|nr:glutathione transferase [Burkholderiaceae bacterium]